MCGDFVSVRVDGEQPITGLADAYVVDHDDLATLDRCGRGVHVDCEWSAVCLDDAQYVFLHGESRVHIADGEDGAISVSAVAKVEVSSSRQAFDKDRGVRVLRDPCLLYTSPSPRDRG